MAEGPEKEDPRQKEQEREERERETGEGLGAHNEKESAEVEEKEPRGGGREGRERERWGDRAGGYDRDIAKRERKRDVFLPKGTFCAGFARSSLLGKAARTRRAAPRRRRNRPRVPAGRFSGGKTSCRYPARESAWSTVVGGYG